MTNVRRSTPLREIFAANVRRVRLASGLSQEKLAELAGLDRTYISSVERSRRNVSIDSIERLAIALSVSAVQLLTE